MTNVNRIKVVVLGGPRVGKSDFLYRHSVTIDNVTTEVEILDTSRCEENGCLYSHIRWGEAFVVVYSVTCKRSFQEARGLLKQLADLRLPSYFTALLLGNKRDLDHAREVCVDEGQQLSLAHGCQFYEVSAAESPAGAALAFQALLREARSVQLLRALPIRRKLGVHSVSRVLGTIFGKNTTKDRKKRPSLSI
ncbi:Ras-related and estrogen-regulated growth inhibitor [Trachymyrmex septentrionalis]|uniref:small monomeric GTPase n=1 Tax=Trachymyrmex septentrionalis TaxID=34720 RepID=A0A151JVR0_9HYME|nr:PREDICTED: ras-related and estrogen-regulated growth inhibitor-like isoform X2 [Trachymyrmex zeteki]XP_018343925.1 PREDICTED: ras-related and estrogen-regulated growth inhibitor-like isoform X2 [Trachymyrmex septentrionalis]XP_018366025.1 PREDICTED: ras-related and estrogen-regulated growth inhibitor-like isoform X2 [Trachymyrmex cornetzi]KYN38070.1 Ras-related and estrogen-regulated growth inhibitor [Trachymyrmex septentrionalis]